MNKKQVITLSAAIAAVIIIGAVWRYRLVRQSASTAPLAGMNPTELMNRSVEVLKDSATKTPADASGYFNLGTFYLNHNKFDEALEAFHAALKIDPKSGPTLENLGFAYYRKNDNNKALAYLKSALEIIPDSPTLHNTLGAVYRERKMYDKALAEHRQAAALRKDAPDDWFNIALVYQEMKSPEEAAAWEKYLAIASRIPSESRYVEIARQNLKKIGKHPPADSQ
jgi:tetratricopeptide (TPR) repeat protein